MYHGIWDIPIQTPNSILISESAFVLRGSELISFLFIWVSLSSLMGSLESGASTKNPQLVSHPKCYSSGLARRRAEVEVGTRMDNKFNPGKFKPNRPINTAAESTDGAHQGPSPDRLLYLSTCLAGHHVDVQLKNGSVYSGTCYATNADKDFAIVLKMCRLTKDASSRGQKAETISKAPSGAFIIPGKEVVQVTAKDLPSTMDELVNKFQCEKEQEIMLDSLISGSSQVDLGRELKPWIPDGDDAHCTELENVFEAPWNRKWDQFETNETLFGVKSTFDEELYTTRLEKGPQVKSLEGEAIRVAREIESEETLNPHLAEERGIHLHENSFSDEEARYSSVHRRLGIEDGELKELSKNNGGIASSSVTKSSDLTPVKCLRAQSNDCAYPCHTSSSGHTEHAASERTLAGFSIPASDGRIESLILSERGRNDQIEKSRPERILNSDNHFPNLNDSHSSKVGLKDDSEIEGLLAESSACASFARSSCETNELVSSSVEWPEDPLSCGTSRGQVDCSTSKSNCERIGLGSNLPSLSPSSSLGFVSSESSALYNKTREFKLNPHARSFIPSPKHYRPHAPVPDGSLYFPANNSPLLQFHEMHLGVGVSHFSGHHQPIMFNPHVAPLQAPPLAYFPQGVHQLQQQQQQMLLGHPRQLLFVPPGYHQPDGPYKVRRDY